MNTVFVSRLPQEIIEEEFKSFFVDCEGFVSSRLRRDRKGNVVGFVEFRSAESAEKAIQANSKLKIRSCLVKLKFSTAAIKSPNSKPSTNTNINCTSKKTKRSDCVANYNTHLTNPTNNPSSGLLSYLLLLFLFSKLFFFSFLESGEEFDGNYSDKNNDKRKKNQIKRARNNL